mmetsp:Transcript_31126/g.34831  ORF Transcript_31126/g.34831 Transcript_31126/m.34831 type:complete len:146 (+) Transcript_31126:308-745(+)
MALFNLNEVKAQIKDGHSAKLLGVWTPTNLLVPMNCQATDFGTPYIPDEKGNVKFLRNNKKNPVTPAHVCKLKQSQKYKYVKDANIGFKILWKDACKLYSFLDESNELMDRQIEQLKQLAETNAADADTTNELTDTFGGLKINKN